MNAYSQLESVVTVWDENITTAPHRFNAREFNLSISNRRVELGHIHNGQLLDILFSVKVRDVLIAEGKAQTHQFVPDSGWISFPIRSQADVQHGEWLLRLSYLMNVARYGRGKQSFDLETAISALKLSPTLRQVAFP